MNARGLPRAVIDAERRRAVETVCEVWRVDDEWWRDPVHRYCVEVILEGGKHVVLYQDLATASWFEQAP